MALDRKVVAVVRALEGDVLHVPLAEPVHLARTCWKGKLNILKLKTFD